MNLAADDSVYFTHHVLLWKDPQVNITTMPLKGAWKRMLAGMPLIMTQAQGPGHIAFSRDAPGELMALPIQPGQSVDVREHHLPGGHRQRGVRLVPDQHLVHAPSSGDDNETHYPLGMFMDRFSAPRQTRACCCCTPAATSSCATWRPAQTILVKPTALIFKDPAVQMQLHFEHPPRGFSGLGLVEQPLSVAAPDGPGPGGRPIGLRAMEGEAGNITSFSYATERRW